MSPSLLLPPLQPPTDRDTIGAAPVAHGAGAISNHEGAVRLRLCLDLPSATAYVTHLRRCARSLMDGLCISREEAEDLELALAELAANAVTHSGGAAPRDDRTCL